MKNLTLSVMLLGVLSTTQGAVLLDETFNFENSVTKIQEAPNWTTLTSEGFTMTPTAEEGGGRTFPATSTPLSYTNGEAYVHSGIGNKLVTNIIGCGGSKEYITSWRQLPNEVNSGSVYLSVLYSANGNPQTQSNAFLGGIGLYSSTSNIANAGAVIWVGKGSDNTTFRFGITRSSTTSSEITWGEQTFSNTDDINKTFLLVLKHTFQTPNNKVELFINPIIGSQSEPTASISYEGEKGTNRSSLDAIMIRSNGSTAFRFALGGIRLSDSWSEAIPTSFSSIEAQSSAVKIIGKQLFYTGEQNAIITLYNTTGQSIKSFPVQPNSITNLEVDKGIYVARIQSTAGVSITETISINN